VSTGLFHGILGIHIVFGTVALVIAPLAMATLKGGLWHRRWGKIFFWAMAGIALTAAGLCFLRTGLFLFLIAVFSFYLAITGYRVLGRKKPPAKPRIFDTAIACAMVLAGGGLIFMGVLSDGSERWVRIAFGIIGLGLGLQDLYRLFKPSPAPKAWMLYHLTRFLGAYIATVTAFSVVNFQFLPYFWRWLWPTFLGVPGIILWRRYYVGKFQKPLYGNPP
jgi:hypothetical protein